jgi:hypothetical protein
MIDYHMIGSTFSIRSAARFGDTFSCTASGKVSTILASE